MNSVFPVRFRALLACAAVFLVNISGFSQTIPELKVGAVQSGGVQLTFATTAGFRYQIFSSSDLIRWIPEGNAVDGNNQVTQVTFSTGAAKQFFKLWLASLPAPIDITVRRLDENLVQISLPSRAGRQYQAYASSDLVHWDPIADLFVGNGQPMSFEFDMRSESPLFFRAYDVVVAPIADMVRIEPGTFIMGSRLNEQDRDLDEDPLTQVVFTRGFWMSKFEVTQREYQQIMGTNPSWFKGDLDRPVEFVSWKEAVAYCARLTQREQAAGRIPPGYAYRLPTEAEFEYSDRAGATSRFFYGDDPTYALLGDYAWFNQNSGGATHPVGLKQPNAFGLYDIAGNVWEWCMDWYYEYYVGGTAYHPIGALSGQTRVFRGGGWDYVASSCRAAFRNNADPTIRLKYLGFRVVLSNGL